jgi:hypothetical protein
MVLAAKTNIEIVQSLLALIDRLAQNLHKAKLHAVQEAVTEATRKAHTCAHICM